MKITYVNQYKSIFEFSEVDVPDFCLFVGKNGAGKTHILKAIENGFIKIDDFKKESIAYFSFQSFLIPNQGLVTVRGLDNEKESAWNLVKKLQSDQNQANESLIRKHILLHTKDRPKIKSLMESGIFLSGKKLSELDRNTFLQYSEYNPDDYQLLSNLTEIFFDYHKKIIISRLQVAEGERGASNEELMQIQSKSPWSFINQMFDAYGLSHRIKAPEFNARDLIEIGNLEYQAKLVFENSDINLEDLSSGEKVLCALAITVFQDQQNKKFPKLLLLDEIDSSLHPSMIRNLLSVINEVFLKNNCKVILATHSPTTASLVDESSVFEVKLGNVKNKIEKISQTQAVEILSEGMMSLEKGLKLFDQISSKALSVITEGKNTLHLEKAITILKPELLAKVDIIKDAASCSGKTQLKPLFEFFKIVSHNKPVLFVFDCDAEKEVGGKTEGNNTFILALKENENNKLAKNGIENIYPESLFEGFVEKNISSSGNATSKFDPKRKQDFLKKVLTSNDAADFAGFGDLIRKMENILNASSKTVS